MERFDRLREIERLDPLADCHEIYRLMTAYEFPWDMVQSLSLALFRTYAVPSIGALLARTGEFTERTQKRYDDTVLILDAVLEHGPGSVPARDAFRRMNAMHGAHDIGNDDLRYVLCTFVVVPVRWLQRYGWRPMSRTEQVASAHYYRVVGRHMGIRDLPRTYEEFVTCLDAYERDRFGHDEGGRRVADATLELFATFPPARLLPRRVSRQVFCALMDDPLLDALELPRPHALVRAAVRGALRLRLGRAPAAAAAGAVLRPAAADDPQLPGRLPGQRPRDPADLRQHSGPAP